MAEARVGISGWVYPAWRKTFYPDGLPHKQELVVRRRAPVVDRDQRILLRPAEAGSFQRWHDETPDDFVFSVKGPRFITH